MHDTVSSPNPGASGGDGEAGQSLRLVGKQELRGNRQAPTGGNAGTSHKGDEKVSKLTLLFYALTVPFRLALVFVCAVVLIGGICVMSCFGGER